MASRYADLWELRDVTYASVGQHGLWWGLNGPDPTAAPSALQPFLDQHGLLTYERLLDDASAAAIGVSGSAAVLASIDPERITRLP